MKILVTEKISKNRFKTPEGYLICKDAILSRVGKQEYLKKEIFPNSDSDEKIEVDRKPEQVFSEIAMASFENKPVTVEHPSDNVTPENFKKLAVGFVRDIRKGEDNGIPVMIGNIIITDSDVINDIENNIRTELSCGYDCDITTGENPQQVNIRGNHVALCLQGRAGNARILDSESSWVKPLKEDNNICDELKSYVDSLDNCKSISELKKMRDKLFDVFIEDFGKKEQKRELIDKLNDKIATLIKAGVKDEKQGNTQEQYSLEKEILEQKLEEAEEELSYYDDPFFNAESREDIKKVEKSILENTVKELKRQISELNNKLEN